MPTLILPPRYTDDSILMREAALRAGWQVLRLSSWSLTQEPKNPVIYGEPLFVAAITEKLGIFPLEPPFDFLTRLPKKFVQRDVIYTDLGTAKKIGDPKFIKPADDKCFKAQIYNALYPDVESIPDILPAETPVLISEPVKWEIEFRCFIINNKLSTISLYLRNGKLTFDASEEELSEATLFINQVIDVIELPPGVVVDIGKIENRGWAVIEANPAWGSGIYECDPDKILPVLEACFSVVDLRWIPNRENPFSQTHRITNNENIVPFAK